MAIISGNPESPTFKNVTIKGDIDVESARSLTIYDTVGANTLTIGAASTAINIPGTLNLTTLGALSMDGGLDITIADTVDDVALVIVNNDTTNNPQTVTITTEGTGDGLNIVKNGPGNGAKIVANINDTSDNVGLFLDVTNAGSGKAYSLITALGGNVGLGVSDPDARVEIFGSGVQLKLAFNSSISISHAVDAGKVYTIRTPVDGQMIFRPIGTERVDFFQIVNASGGPILNVDALNDRIGICTLAPATPLDVDTGTDIQQLRIDRTGTTTTDSIVEFVSDVGGSNTTVCKILVDGDLENTNNSYGAISDRKLKENIIPAKYMLDKFMELQFRNFNFKNNPGLKQFGLIADEVKEIFPGLIKTNPETFIDSIKYSVISMISAKVFQEHMEKFHAFKKPKKINSNIIRMIILIMLVIIFLTINIPIDIESYLENEWIKKIFYFYK